MWYMSQRSNQIRQWEGETFPWKGSVLFIKEGYDGPQSDHNSSLSWFLGMSSLKQDMFISEQHIENSVSRILALTHSTPKFSEHSAQDVLQIYNLLEDLHEGGVFTHLISTVRCSIPPPTRRSNPIPIQPNPLIGLGVLNHSMVI